MSKATIGFNVNTFLLVLGTIIVTMIVIAIVVNTPQLTDGAVEEEPQGEVRTVYVGRLMFKWSPEPVEGSDRFYFHGATIIGDFSSYYNLRIGHHYWKGSGQAMSDIVTTVKIGETYFIGYWRVKILELEPDYIKFEILGEIGE